ncbi:hypothetical protein TCAL_03909 [Tigriopus californicus]|uniref:BTB domain-containing protein n=1 Tax=Tigriopus californicus TaxID=6832 RepID=A0A553NB73_TIGCA|nr:hypothetical protein TCAL_03909 [Tigriopus californicus]|eukprot:TCALIF_03909-PA protein Name:"Protein of unknown function" AED:0.02 eAED:0.02 QI:751/0.75/0.8/1/0.75/0.6/5/677/1591
MAPPPRGAFRRFRCRQRGRYMGEALKRALTLGPTWDLVLHSDAGERFRCHQAVLGAVSPVLKSILAGWEFMVLSHPVIILPDISSRALDTFLKFVYTGSVVITIFEPEPPPVPKAAQTAPAPPLPKSLPPAKPPPSQLPLAKAPPGLLPPANQRRGVKPSVESTIHRPAKVALPPTDSTDLASPPTTVALKQTDPRLAPRTSPSSPADASPKPNPTREVTLTNNPSMRTHLSSIPKSVSIQPPSSTSLSSHVPATSVTPKDQASSKPRIVKPPLSKTNSSDINLSILKPALDQPSITDQSSEKASKPSVAGSPLGQILPRSETVSSKPKTLLNELETSSNRLEKSSTNTETLSSRPETSPTEPGALPSQPETSSSKAEVPLSEPEALSSKPETSSSSKTSKTLSHHETLFPKSEIVSSQPKVLSSKSEAPFSKPETSSSEPKNSFSQPKALSSELEAPLLKPENSAKPKTLSPPEASFPNSGTSSSKPETSSMKPKTISAKSETPLSKPEASSMKPKTISTKSEAPFSKPEILPAKPEVLSQPETSFPKSETISSKPKTTLPSKSEAINSEPEKLSCETETPFSKSGDSSPQPESSPSKSEKSSSSKLESSKHQIEDPPPPVPTSTADSINLQALEADLARLHGEIVPDPEPNPPSLPVSETVDRVAPLLEASTTEETPAVAPPSLELPYGTPYEASYESPDTLNSTVEDDSQPVDGFVMPSNFDLPPDYLSQARTNTETVYAPDPTLPVGLSNEQPRLSYDFLCLSPLSNATPRHEPDYYIQANEIDSTNDHPGHENAFQVGRSWSSAEESGSSPEPSESPDAKLFPQSPYRIDLKDKLQVRAHPSEPKTTGAAPKQPVIENSKQDPHLSKKADLRPESPKATEITSKKAESIKPDQGQQGPGNKEPKSVAVSMAEVPKLTERSIEKSGLEASKQHQPLQAKKDPASQAGPSSETSKVMGISTKKPLSEMAKPNHVPPPKKELRTGDHLPTEKAKVCETAKNSSIVKNVTNSSSPNPSDIVTKTLLPENVVKVPIISVRTDLKVKSSSISPKSSDVSANSVKKSVPENSKHTHPSPHVSKDLKTKAKNSSSSSVTTPKDIMDELFGTDEGPKKKKINPTKSVSTVPSSKPTTPVVPTSNQTISASNDPSPKEKHAVSVREELEAKRQRMLQMLKQEEPRPSPDVRPLKKRTPATYVSIHEPEKSWLVADSDFEEEEAALSSSSSSKSSAEDVEASTDCEQVRKSRQERLQKRRRKLGVPTWFDRGGRKVEVKYFETGAENVLELAHYRLRLLAGDDGDSDGSGDEDMKSKRGGDDGSGNWRSRRRAQRSVDSKRTDFSKLKRTFSEFQERSKKGRTRSSSSSRSSSRSSRSSSDDENTHRRRPKMRPGPRPLIGSPSKSRKGKKKPQSESDTDKQRVGLKRHHSHEPLQGQSAKSPLVPFKIRKLGGGPGHSGHSHEDKKPGKLGPTQGPSSAPRQSVDALFGTVHSYGLSSEGSLAKSAIHPQKEAIMSMSFKKKKKDTAEIGDTPLSNDTNNVAGPNGLPSVASSATKHPGNALVVIEKLTPGLKIKNQRTILSDDSDSDTKLDGTKS